MKAEKMGNAKKKIWTTAYVVDIAIVANEESEMKEMMKTNERFLKTKWLGSNIEKSNIIKFNKAKGKRRTT